MVDVFISYDHEDRDRVALIVEEIERRGWDVFWDRDLTPGDDFGNRLQSQIDQSRCAVVVWTSRSVTSRWVKAEATHAMTSSRLIPIMLDDVDLPFPFNTQDTLDLRGWPDLDTDTSFRRLLNEISRDQAPDQASSAEGSDPRLSMRLARKVVDAISGPAIKPFREALRGTLSESEHHRLLIAAAHFDQFTETSMDRAHALLVDLARARPDVRQISELRDRCAWWLAIYGLEAMTTETTESEFVTEDDSAFEETLGARMDSPDERDLICYGAHVLLPAGCHREAIAFLEQAERCDPMSAEIKLHLARSALAAFDFGRALETLTACLQLAPGASIALLLHAIVTSQIGKTGLAVLSAAEISSPPEFAELARRVAGGEFAAADALEQVEAALARRRQPVSLTRAPARVLPLESGAVGMRAMARLRALKR